MPFSKEAVDVFKQIQKTEDPSDRVDLMLQLAMVYVNDLDETDEAIGEEIHDMVADVIERRSAYERQAMLLARVLMRSIPPFLAQNHEGSESAPSEKSKSN